MNEYHLNILTDKEMDSESFVRNLLEDWFQLDAGLVPEYFDVGEPVRRGFAKEGVESAVQLWLEEGMAVQLMRKRKPKYEAAIEWFRERNLRDPRLFPWSCTIWLDGSAGDDLALKLLRFLIVNFQPSFGHATSYENHRIKHFIAFDDRMGRTEKYVGLDILKHQEKLPGVYWATYFGPWAVDRIGRERFRDLDVRIIEPIANGFLIIAFDSCDSAGSREADESENRVKTHFGENHFFDKKANSIELESTAFEDAELIEEKIAKKKSARRTE